MNLNHLILCQLFVLSIKLSFSSLGESTGIGDYIVDQNAEKDYDYAGFTQMALNDGSYRYEQRSGGDMNGGYGFNHHSASVDFIFYDKPLAHPIYSLSVINTARPVHRSLFQPISSENTKKYASPAIQVSPPPHRTLKPGSVPVYRSFYHEDVPRVMYGDDQFERIEQQVISLPILVAKGYEK